MERTKNRSDKESIKKVILFGSIRRAKVPYEDLRFFYTTCIRSVLDYAVPMFYYLLPKYLTHELERKQKRVFAITCHGHHNNESLTRIDLVIVIYAMPFLMTFLIT